MRLIGFLIVNLLTYFKKECWPNECIASDYVDGDSCDTVINNREVSLSAVPCDDDSVHDRHSSSEASWSRDGVDFTEKKVEDSCGYKVEEFNDVRYIRLNDFYKILKSLGELYGFNINLRDTFGHEKAPGQQKEIE